MAHPRGSRPHYGRSPRPSWRNMRGRKVQDDITGAWHYEAEMVTNEDGQQVYGFDRRSLDRRYDLDGAGGRE